MTQAFYPSVMHVVICQPVLLALKYSYGAEMVQQGQYQVWAPEY